jgi:hypothetical protein
MNTSLVPLFFFALILIGLMSVVAFIKSRQPGQRLGFTLLESGIWGCSLIACAGADYLLVMLNSNHIWI